MGKSPGRWIKNLVLGKKSSNSNLSKGKEKLYAARKEEVLVSSQLTVSDFSVAPQSLSAPIPATVTRNGVNLEKDISADLQNGGVNVASIENDGDHDASSNLSPQEDSQSLRLKEAATKAQAAFRGYLARRAFHTLKGIIRLQALIRGHSVRRQAVATLCSAWGIVKFQALVRGQKVRRTDIAIEVQKIYLRALPVAKSSSELSASARVKNLSNNAFVRKLLSSSPTVLPLRLQYGPGEPNSAREWLERWMRLRFWERPQSIRSLTSKSQVKVECNKHEQGKTKQTIWKLSNGKVENGFNCSTSENEKHKHNPRKVSKNPADPVQEHPQNEIGKVKRHLRKIPDSTKEISGRAEVNTETPNQTVQKTSASSVVDVFEGNCAEKRNVVSIALAKPSNLEANPKLSTANDSVEESNTAPAVDSQPTESNGKVENMPATDEQLSSKDGIISGENLNTSHRRASLPGKIDYKENGLCSTPKVPSYMAPTESVKAKLRGQGFPRYSRDVIEKNGVTRRHSLPSATNSNLSSLSPRAQRLVQAAGKGAMRNDKSLSSSRDAGDKGIKADWRR